MSLQQRYTRRQKRPKTNYQQEQQKRQQDQQEQQQKTSTNEHTRPRNNSQAKLKQAYQYKPTNFKNKFLVQAYPCIKGRDETTPPPPQFILTHTD